ncbi:hypothetical protein [Rathayibacter sp. AY1A7]|uniref:hypothetical protein n=1 Tax=Rathayibacter sp. AY1A7 TaxID=2080524 RepID=UPI000CE75964|nr:hypothetical protein [Rathayibacter sp. AY1A7]PPF20870.1 hypothetical protein C5B95_07360 [Rathayibacter sp. AY1A7]
MPDLEDQVALRGRLTADVERLTAQLIALEEVAGGVDPEMLAASGIDATRFAQDPDELEAVRLWRSTYEAELRYYFAHFHQSDGYAAHDLAELAKLARMLLQPLGL